METTTIEISVENWRWLSSQKQRPGESFNDVLDQLREQRDDTHATTPTDSDELASEAQSPSESSTDSNPADNDIAATPPDGDENAADNATSEISADNIPHDLDIPGSGETYERRRRAIARLYAHLKREGTASRADFLELINPDNLDYASERSFWTNCVKGRDNLRALPGVQPPGEGEHTWHYTGQSNEEDDDR